MIYTILFWFIVIISLFGVACIIVLFALSDLNTILKFLSYVASVALGFLLGLLHIIRWSIQDKKDNTKKPSS